MSSKGKQRNLEVGKEEKRREAGYHEDSSNLVTWERKALHFDFGSFRDTSTIVRFLSIAQGCCKAKNLAGFSR